MKSISSVVVFLDSVAAAGRAGSSAVQKSNLPRMVVWRTRLAIEPTEHIEKYRICNPHTVSTMTNRSASRLENRTLLTYDGECGVKHLLGGGNGSWLAGTKFC